MAAPSYRISTTCADGINESNPTGNQCSEAMNVWSPNGYVEQRPGFVAQHPIITNPGSTSPTRFVFLYEDVSTGIFTSSADGSTLTIGAADARTAAVAGDRWYIGLNGIPLKLAIYVTSANTNGVRAEAEIPGSSDGSTWVPFTSIVEYQQTTSASGYVSCEYKHTANTLSTVGWTIFEMTPPSSAWYTPTINGIVNRYWIRFTFVSDSDATTTAGLQIDNGFVTTGPLFYGTSTYRPTCSGLHSVMFKNSSCIIGANTNSRGEDVRQPRIVVFDGFPSTRTVKYQFPETTLVARTSGTRTNPSTVAVIPEVGEAYVTLDNRVAVIRERYEYQDQISATVENRDFAVGVAAPWDSRTVSQLGDFPSAKFISFFQNRLWVIDKDDTLRWSAAVPYHRVWPSLAFATLCEDDNSPTTGLKPLQEFQVIYKNDSIWVSSFVDFDAFNIPHFTPRKVVSGIGSVASGSIQNIQGTHVFLGENDIYAFDGSSVESVTIDKNTNSKRLQDTLSRITPSARQFASSVNWRSKKCYILSVPVDGSDNNNRTIVWDYGHNRFWVWGFGADYWITTEGSYDEEILYFATTGKNEGSVIRVNIGGIYRFGVGCLDNGYGVSSDIFSTYIGYFKKYGPIDTEPYVVTRLIGYDDNTKKSLTSLELTAENTGLFLSSSITRNDMSVDDPERELATILSGTCDAKLDSAIFGTSKFANEYELTRVNRNIRIGNAKSVRVKVSSNHAPMKLHNVTAGFNILRGRQ
jgi:hypothetical protein